MEADTVRVKLTVVPQNEASDVLAQWDSEDSYYTSMASSIAGKLNVKARQYPYLETNESQATTMVLDVSIPIDSPVTIVYLDPRSDAGLPHTRGLRGIALPVFLLWEPSEKTIRHELVHLSQKQYPQRWWEWYDKAWGFRRATTEEYMGIPEKWRERRRINPDTLGSPYTVWKDRWIPLSVFLNEQHPDLRHCKRGFWDCRMSQWTWEPPPGWISTFGQGFNDEHPHEIAAHWIDGSAGEKKQDYFRILPL